MSREPTAYHPSLRPPAVRGYLSAVTASPLRLAALSLLAATIACAGAPGPDAGAREAEGAVAGGATQPAERPLAAVAAQRVVVVPLQQAPEASAAVEAAAVDAELAFALEERGFGSRWTTAEGARRMARSNPTFTGDPGDVGLGGTPPKPGADLVEPTASQLRALAALADARYVVVPQALRADTTGGATRLRLRVTLVDTRRQQVLWTGETAGVPVADTPPAARPARIAAQFVDLIAAPPPP